MLRFNTLLSECGSISDDKNYTHTVGNNLIRYFNLHDSKVEHFWRGYCQLIQEQSEQKDGAITNHEIITIKEKSTTEMPFVVALRLRYNKNEGEPFSDDFLHLLIYSYQQAMRETLQVDSDKLICIVLENEPWIDASGSTCCDIELRFPYCKVNAVYQQKVVHPKAINHLRDLNVLSTLERQPLDDWDKMIATNASLKPLSLYGSVEEKNQKQLIMSRCYRELPDPQESKEEDIKEQEAELEDLFDGSRHIHVIKGLMQRQIFQEQDETNFWLPLFLSSGYDQTITLPLVDESENKVFHLESGGDTDWDITMSMISILNNVELNESEWYDMGRALCQVDNGGLNGLNVWIEYSKRKGHPHQSCSGIYNDLKRMPITTTFRTLAWFAREKARVAYDAWHQAWCEPSMKKALNMSHTDVAIALYRVFWLDYVCARDKKGWYQYRNHHWNKIDDGLELRQDISDRFVSYYELMRTKMSQRVMESSDPSIKKEGEAAINSVCKLIHKLKTITYKTSLMKEAIDHFSVYRDFIGLLDENDGLLGVRNGVIELYKDKAFFRPGRPEDFVSKNMNIYYIDYSKEDMKEEKMEEIKENKKSPLQRLKEWLRKVFTNKDTLHFFLKFSASCLRGGNIDKIFPVFTGSGNNSKSMIVKLFGHTFGNYCIKLPLTFLTGKRQQSSGATPETIRARAARIAFVDEPGGDETIGNGQLKGGTGGDSFYSRGLHQEGREVKMTYKLIMQCNNVPVIPHADKATHNRLKVFPFLSTWSIDAPESEEEQFKTRIFKLISRFEDQIPSMASAFLWMMLQYYPYYVKEGLDHPEEVVIATKEYWNDTDVYNQFAIDSIEVVMHEGKQDLNAKLSLSDVYNNFKLWYRDNFPQTKPPERAVVKRELEARWGKMSTGKWLGIRLKNMQAANLSMSAMLS